jgi:ADP-ribose pyrophosphatase YjhB (NUDIX family)
VQYDPEDEAWWLPGGDLVPYEHPEEAARRVFDDLGLKLSSMKMVKIDSFRGRRGWHLMFNYLIEATGEPKGETPFAWHKPDKMPRTKHGTWEHDQVKAALGM